jgi:PAS domain S-box-containing protein
MANATPSPIALVEDLQTQISQLRHFCRAIGFTTATFSLVAILAGLLWRDWSIGAVGLLVGGYSLTVWISDFHLRHHRLQHATVLLSVGIVVAEVAICLALPKLGPTLVLASLFPLVIATQYGTPYVRNRLLWATGLSTAAIICGWRFLPASRLNIPDEFLAFYQMTSMYAVIVLVGLLCWQIRGRMQARIADADEANAATERERARYEAALRSQYDVVIATDERGYVTLINAAAEEFTGWTLAEVAGRHIADTFCFETTDAVMGAEDLVERVLSTRKGFLELKGVKLIARNHDRVWQVTVSAAPIVSGDTLLGVIFTFRDLTEHMQAIERDQAAERMRVVERLAAGIAPDFDEAFTSIGGIGRKIGEQVTMHEMPDIDDVNTLVRAGDKAANMARQLLAIGQRQPVRPETIEFGALVAQIAEDLPKTLGRDVCVIQQNEPGVGSIRADRKQLTDAIYQVANYARDTMPAGGTLQLETTNLFLQAGSPSPGLPDQGGAYVQLTIRDSGGGWNQKDLLHLLEPFYEPTRGASRRAPQSAFNLSVVNGLVRQNGGWLSVDSQLRVGSSYTMFFPRVDVEEWLARTGSGDDVWPPAEIGRPHSPIVVQGIHM